MEKKSDKEVDISIIIPIFNEQNIIEELYNRLKITVSEITENYEFIFVNDGSKDLSFLELLKLSEQNQRVFYINFSRNFGHQIAVTAGLDICRGKAVVIIDGDLQDPPELIAEMHDKYLEGFDIVYARREKRIGESIFKKITAKIFYRLLKKITSIEIPLDTGDFRLIDRKVVKYLKLMPEQNKFLRGQIAWLGFKSSEVLFIRDERKHGKTGYSFGKMLRFALDGITSFSDKPLQMVSFLGIFFSFFSFVIIVYAVYSHFILHRTITGWTSIIISTMFIGGVQLISIGVIGEYINRINRNVLNRPLYIVEKSNYDQEGNLEK